MLFDLIYIFSWLVCIFVGGLLGYRIVSFIFIFFFGTKYNFVIKDKNGNEKKIVKYVKDFSDLEDFILESYNNRHKKDD
ncbi:hypothetical protein TYM08_P3008 [Marinicellulosiphila megalodicopiae]